MIFGWWHCWIDLEGQVVVGDLLDISMLGTAEKLWRAALSSAISVVMVLSPDNPVGGIDFSQRRPKEIVSFKVILPIRWTMFW